MKQAKQIFDRDFTISSVDRRLYGIFLESIDDIVYGGMYDPEHPTADENGFRQDVMELLRELKTTLIRTPGGNYVSGYHWKDGIGPKAERPCKKELAWNQLDNNHMGIDEYNLYNQLLGTEFMIAVNLGTGSLDEAADEVDYCNTPSGTYWSDLRIKNGYKDPYNLKLWCAGNEMDGPWQIGRKTPEEYGRICTEASKMMKWMDPSIEIVACGSCTNEIGHTTYPEWDRIVLEDCYEHVDYLALHRYYSYDPKVFAAYPNPFTIEDIAYLGIDLTKYIDTVLAAADYVKGLKGSEKTIHISFDEWGTSTSFRVAPDDLDWHEHPSENDERAENLIDALLHGTFLITFLNKSDRVKIACESIAIPRMIAAQKGSGAYKQTTFYPFQQAATYGYGTVLQPNLKSPTVKTQFGDVPALQSAAVYNEEENTITVFAVNLDLRNDIVLENDFRSFGEIELIEHFELYDDQPLAVNTYENPERIVPHAVPVKDVGSSVVLPKHSWHVLRYQVK